MQCDSGAREHGRRDNITSKLHGNVLAIKEQQSAAAGTTCVASHRKAMSIQAYSVSCAWTLTTGIAYKRAERYMRHLHSTVEESEYTCMSVIASMQVTKPTLLYPTI